MEQRELKREGHQQLGGKGLVPLEGEKGGVEEQEAFTDFLPIFPSSIVIDSSLPHLWLLAATGTVLFSKSALWGLSHPRA